MLGKGYFSGLLTGGMLGVLVGFFFAEGAKTDPSFEKNEEEYLEEMTNEQERQP